MVAACGLDWIRNLADSGTPGLRLTGEPAATVREISEPCSALSGRSQYVAAREMSALAARAWRPSLASSEIGVIDVGNLGGDSNGHTSIVWIV